MSDDLRLFIGMRTGSVVKKPIGRAVTVLKESGLNCRYIPPENIHLTLRFLGDCPRIMTGPLGDCLKKAAARIEPFSAGVLGFGAFPNDRRARVVWLGLEETEAMSRLYDGLSSQLADLGFPEENRSYRPHVTFARLKKPARVDLSLVEGIDTGGRETFNEIVLFSSILSPKGAKYEAITEARFD